MREAIALINRSKMSCTDLSAFGDPVMYVHARNETILKVQYTEDCYSFFDYRTDYLFTEQSIDDLELHIKSIEVGLEDDLDLNGNIDRDTIPDGVFLQ